MASRKQQNKAIERKNKNQRRITAIITGAVLLVVLLAIAWVAWDVQSRRWVMTFEGTRIATSDLQIMEWLVNTSWEGVHMDIRVPDHRDAVLSTLVNTLTIMHRADRHGIGVNAQDIEDGLPMMAMTGLPENYHRRAVELWAAFNVLPERLTSHYFPDYAPDAVVLAEYMDANRNRYANTTVIYITSQDGDVLEEIAAMVAAGDLDGVEHFEELIREYSMWYFEGEEITTSSIVGLINEFEIFHESDALLGLPEGAVSHVVEIWPEMFMLMYIVERTDAEDSAIEESFMQQRRNAQFSELMEEWVENANYRPHQRTLNSL